MSGSPTEVAEITIHLHQLNARCRAANGESLEVAHLIGVALADVKARKLVAHGEFGSWCEKTFGFQKTQRAAYMYLAKHWADLPEARAWAQGAGLCHDDLTINGVIRLLRARNAASAAPAATKPRKNPADLEAEIARLKAELFAAQYNKPRVRVPQSEVMKAKKIFAMWAHIATDTGSADVAEIRLLKLAARHHVSIQDYLAYLGFKVPPHRNFGADEMKGGTARGSLEPVNRGRERLEERHLMPVGDVIIPPASLMRNIVPIPPEYPLRGF